MEQIDRMDNEKMGAGKAIPAGFAAYTVTGIVNGFLPLLIAVLAKNMAFGLMSLGFMALAYFGIRCAGHFFSGKVARIIGYKITIIIGLIISAFGSLALGLFPDLMGLKAGIWLGLVLCGTGAGLVTVPVGNAVRWYSGEDDRTVKCLHFFNLGGQCIAMILSVLVLTAAGDAAWRVLAAIFAVLPVMCAMLFIFIFFEDPDTDEEPSDLQNLFGNSAFWVVFLLMLFAGATEQSMGHWIAYFSDVPLEASGIAGRLLGPSLFAVGLMVSRLLYIQFPERFRLQRFVVYGAFLALAAFLLAILSGNEGLALAGCILVGFATGFMRQGMFSLASSKISDMETATFGLLMLAGDLGYGVGPALVGTVSGILDNNLKKGMIIALIFPIAMIVTIMKVNKNLTHKLIRDKRTWIGIACTALVIVLSTFTSGCTTAVNTPTPTPTQIVYNSPVPVQTLPAETATPTATPTPETPVATATPTPTRKPTVAPTNTPTPTPTGIPGVTITPRTGTVVVTVDEGSSLHVRALPDRSGSSIGGAKNGEEFQLTGETSNGWWQISFNGQVAYISQSYSKIKGSSGSVTPTPTRAAATSTPTPTPTSGTTVKVTPTPTPRATATPTLPPAAGTTFENYVNFNGRAYIVMDAKTTEILHAYNETDQLSPASLTKMMTALIAVDQYYLTDICPMPVEALRWNDVLFNGKVNAGLDNEMSTFAIFANSTAGKKTVDQKFTAEQWAAAEYTVEERLYQLLMSSCADAGEALAFMYQEDLTCFAEELMAAKAEQLGLISTSFNNAVGADKTCGAQFDGNLSSAQDLAMIAREIMENDEYYILRQIVGTSTYTIPARGDIPAVTLTNGNKLLTDSSYKSSNFTCIGIKTGYTGDAGYCLAACGKDVDGNEVIVVTLGAPTRNDSFAETMRMLDYVFRYEK